MKVMVIGVGNVGRVIVRDLLENWELDEVIAVDYNIDSLKKFAEEVSDPKLTIEKGDIRDIDKTAEQMKRADFIINSSWYEFNLHAIKAMLKAKRDMLDIGGLYWMTKKELKWDEEVKKAGLTLLLGAGDDPGTSNVLARYGANKLDEVHDIHFRWGAKEMKEKGGFSFSVLTVMDEATLNAVMYIDGKIVEVPPLSHRELTYFPEPIGYLETYAIIHSELATIPFTIEGVRNVDYKDNWDESFLPIIDFLRDTGLTGRDEIDVMGTKVSPLHVIGTLIKPYEPPDTYGCLKVTVSGIKDGIETKYTYYVGPVQGRHEWNAGETALTTAFGAVAGLRVLIDGYAPKGVVPCESIEKPEIWIEELTKRGVPVLEEEKIIKPL
jgi:lysine 6-dehydrogenase